MDERACNPASRSRGVVVVRLLAFQPLANRVRFLTGSLLGFSKWESCRTMPLVGGFSRGSPVPPHPCIPALLHTHLASPSSVLKTSISTPHGRALQESEFCLWRQTMNAHGTYARSWTGNRDEVPFEPPKLMVRNLDPRAAAIVDKCSLEIRQQIELRSIPDIEQVFHAHECMSLGRARIVAQGPRDNCGTRATRAGHVAERGHGLAYIAQSCWRVRKRLLRVENAPKSWSAGFLGDLLFHPPLHSDAVSYSPPSPSSASSAGVQGRGKRENPEKTRRPAALSGTVPTCENPGGILGRGLNPKASEQLARVSRQIAVNGRQFETRTPAPFSPLGVYQPGLRDSSPANERRAAPATGQSALASREVGVGSEGRLQEGKGACPPRSFGAGFRLLRRFIRRSTVVRLQNNEFVIGVTVYVYIRRSYSFSGIKLLRPLAVAAATSFAGLIGAESCLVNYAPITENVSIVATLVASPPAAGGGAAVAAHACAVSATITQRARVRVVCLEAAGSRHFVLGSLATWLHVNISPLPSVIALTIASHLIRNAQDDSEPIADLQRNKHRVPYTARCGATLGYLLPGGSTSFTLPRKMVSYSAPTETSPRLVSFRPPPPEQTRDRNSQESARATRRRQAHIHLTSLLAGPPWHPMRRNARAGETRRPATSSCMIPSCEYPGVTQFAFVGGEQANRSASTAPIGRVVFVPGVVCGVVDDIWPNGVENGREEQTLALCVSSQSFSLSYPLSERCDKEEGRPDIERERSQHWPCRYRVCNALVRYTQWSLELVMKSLWLARTVAVAPVSTGGVRPLATRVKRHVLTAHASWRPACTVDAASTRQTSCLSPGRGTVLINPISKHSGADLHQQSSQRHITPPEDRPCHQPRCVESICSLSRAHKGLWSLPCCQINPRNF
ncbi:hypothetical protein PR048_033694 [Dryococelus australis]|uniref:Uncharacterized protein n=1 Tax=Dryococelus australis TaxID=614101 RepID=A0ABQ9G0Z8_9NEOP|nr:hypothetical protein PR048_033694 [Dryococelus australis]